VCFRCWSPKVNDAAIPLYSEREAEIYDFDHGTKVDDIDFWTELSRLTCRRGGRVLELGCGTLRVGLALARRGFRVCGVDNSTAMLTRARLKLARESGGIRSRITLRTRDARRLSKLRDFDLIVAPYNFLSAFTRHVDQVALLRGAKSSLHENGLIVLDLPRFDVQRCRRHWVDWGKKEISIKYKTEMVNPALQTGECWISEIRIRFFSEMEIRRLARSSGLKVLAILGNCAAPDGCDKRAFRIALGMRRGGTEGTFCANGRQHNAGELQRRQRPRLNDPLGRMAATANRR
jgi:SAM-dependent methyltransferase